jgi:hypothetical protein
MTPTPQPQPATTPVNGPFSQTEVSLYCDESRHEGQRSQQYMVIGGLWLPRDNRGEILDGLRAIQNLHRITSELKWGKVSQTKLAGYQAVVDFVAARLDIHFRCIVVDKSKVNHDKYFQNDRQFGFWVFYWHCLKQWMGNQNTYFISIDFKPESLHFGPRRLREVLENECIRRCWLKSLACVDSRENLFCQIADVFIGAVGYEQNGLAGSPAKHALATHIARAYCRRDLKGNDLPSVRRFNIWRIWS